MIPSTAQRVPESTAEHVNDKIRRSTEERIARTVAAGPEAIDRRLSELDREWDTERTLEANASVVILIGLALGAFASPWWFLLPTAVAAFLLQHAIQGWCPPLPVFRRLGFRTQTEIGQERTALKAIRGDFQTLPADDMVRASTSAERFLQAATM